MLFDETSRERWILYAMGGVMGIIPLDETVGRVALLTMRSDLNMTQVTTHLVINSYHLVFAGLAEADATIWRRHLKLRSGRSRIVSRIFDAQAVQGLT